MPKRIYLDTAAGFLGNPSSAHKEGRRARAMLEEARTTIARLVEVQADDIVFTSGATESNALAILGSVRARRRGAGNDTPGRNRLHALYLPTAHASIVENMRLLSEEGVQVEPLPVRGERVDIDALADMLRPETVLVSMDAVCGETGMIWNTHEVAALLRRVRGGGAYPLLHVDASQAPLTQKVTRDHFGADLLVFDASKVGAVRGAGVCIAHRTIPIDPLYRGGGQERGVRPGTENPENARHFAAAFSRAVKESTSFKTRSGTQRAFLINLLLDRIPDLHIQEGRAQAPNILNISLPGRDTDYLVMLLDAAGISVSTRSACETDAERGSRAVFVLTGDTDRSRATLRISWGPRVTTSALKRFARALEREVAFVDSYAQG